MKEKRFKVTTGSFLDNNKIITDTETGVQYLFVQSGYSGGLAVLIDKDGKPLIDNGNNEE